MLSASISIGEITHSYMLIAAAMIGGYMAMNIGANDVANNVGPAVGPEGRLIDQGLIPLPADH